MTTIEQELIKTFQFHKGTIKTQNVGKPTVYDAYFNSIKVQLKRID